VTDPRTAEEKRVHAQRTGDEPPGQRFLSPDGKAPPPTKGRVIGAVELRKNNPEVQDDQKVAS
jgi:hypothetical protein